jgi:uncharacterized membrane protein YqhA
MTSPTRWERLDRCPDRDLGHPEERMARLVQNSRYMVGLGVIALLASSLAAFGWSVAKAVGVITVIVQSYGQDKHIAIALVEVVDGGLIASVLLVVAVSLYEIFIADLNVPRGMVAHNLYELKGKLSMMIVLVMALKFLEHLEEWSNATDTLLYGLAISAVSAALIALSYLGSKNTGGQE